MTTKKKVLGVDPLSWIKQTKEDLIEEISLEKPKNKEEIELPKYETYEVKLTLRISDSHLDYLTRLERDIMKSRSSKNKKERITKKAVRKEKIRGKEKTVREKKTRRKEKRRGQEKIGGKEKSIRKSKERR